MKNFQKQLMTAVSLVGGVCVLLAADSAFCQNNQPENAQALLEKVKSRELERRTTAKQTEIDRLQQDISKTKTEAEGLQQTIDSTALMIAESGSNLDQLVGERKRLEQVLAVTTQRIEAERRKSDGLRTLTDAQTKSLAALMKRTEEVDVRSRLKAVELKFLAEGKPVPDEGDTKRNSELQKLRKSLASCETSTATEEKNARAAMKAASAKLELADAAAAKAKRMSEETEAGALEPVAEKSVSDKAESPESAKAAPKR